MRDSNTENINRSTEFLRHLTIFHINFPSFPFCVHEFRSSPADQRSYLQGGVAWVTLLKFMAWSLYVSAQQAIPAASTRVEVQRCWLCVLGHISVPRRG